MAELKQEKLNRQSPFYRLMREMGIRPKGFSKYCMGQSLTNNKHIKSNRFKANLIRLKREHNLMNDISTPLSSHFFSMLLVNIVFLGVMLRGIFYRHSPDRNSLLVFLCSAPEYF